jgi:hypothetical protein
MKQIWLQLSDLFRNICLVLNTRHMLRNKSDYNTRYTLRIISDRYRLQNKSDYNTRNIRVHILSDRYRVQSKSGYNTRHTLRNRSETL